MLLPCTWACSGGEGTSLTFRLQELQTDLEANGRAHGDSRERPPLHLGWTATQQHQKYMGMGGNSVAGQSSLSHAAACRTSPLPPGAKKARMLPLPSPAHLPIKPVQPPRVLC